MHADNELWSIDDAMLERLKREPLETLLSLVESEGVAKATQRFGLRKIDVLQLCVARAFLESPEVKAAWAIIQSDQYEAATDLKDFMSSTISGRANQEWRRRHPLPRNSNLPVTNVLDTPIRLRFRAERVRLGLSQRDVARMTFFGASSKQVSDFELGKAKSRVERKILSDINYIRGMDVAYVLSGTRARWVAP